jgi:hypothetical protein
MALQEKLRTALQAAPLLYRALRSARAIIHFGPWRYAARRIIRLARPPQKKAASSNCGLFRFDTALIVETLRANGNCAVGSFPSDGLSRVRAITDKLPPGEYGEFHEIPEVRELTECAATLNVVREYLQAEPELIECSLFVAQAENPATPLAYDSDRHFHFEDAGWHSLSLFVYLTDVSEDSGAHQVVIGTHRALPVWDAIRGSIPESEIKARYPHHIRTIVGPAGTIFFEDTSAIHRRQIHTRRHVVLHILFVSRRCWASKARPIRRYSDYLRAHRDVTLESR